MRITAGSVVTAGALAGADADAEDGEADADAEDGEEAAAGVAAGCAEAQDASIASGISSPK
jgi:hypothetical protein